MSTGAARYGRASKYHARAVERDGKRFDSLLEARRWSLLRIMEQAGEISDLQHHVTFALRVGQETLGHYEADFTYTKDCAQVIEDAKGVETALFRWKAKHMAAQGNPVTIWPEKKRKAKKRKACDPAVLIVD